MAQHDMNIANASGAVVRADLNDAFEAIATQNSGSTAPSTTFAHQWWMDESTNILKIRNAANTTWINVASKSGSTWTLFNVISTGKHELPIVARAMVPALTDGCAALAQIDSGSEDVNAEYLAFDASSAEIASFQFPAPKSSDETVGIEFKAMWMHPSTTTNFGVTWRLELLARGNDDALNAAFGTAQEVDDTGGTTNDIYVSDWSSAVTPGGTWAEGDILFGRVTRDVADGNDTLAVDAHLVAIVLRITVVGANDA